MVCLASYKLCHRHRKTALQLLQTKGKIVTFERQKNKTREMQKARSSKDTCKCALFEKHSSLIER